MPKQPSGKLPVIKPDGAKDDSFYDQVFQVARLIPKGRVTSYGAIGAYLGAKSSARMVGWAMSASHKVRPRIPAHRVVNNAGLLSGKHHFGGDRMQQLLEKEGIEVKDNKVINFKELFWDPLKELL